MIHIQAKQYQVVIWEHPDRFSGGPALRFDFDTIDEARAEYEKHRLEGTYAAGMILQWHKLSGIWDLVEQYPGA